MLKSDHKPAALAPHQEKAGPRLARISKNRGLLALAARVITL